MNSRVATRGDKSKDECVREKVGNGIVPID